MTINELIETGARIINQNPEAITSRCRKTDLVFIRHAISDIAQKGGYTYSRIGRELHRDHSTIIHSCQVSADLLQTDKKYRKLFNSLNESYVLSYSI
jgi:chromosomal replication initiation ATPase DnaA